MSLNGLYSADVPLRNCSLLIMTAYVSKDVCSSSKR